jgi:hypothetical protein
MNIQSKPCIFVGYLEDVKGYRLIHLDTHELIINRSVLFDEHPPRHLASSYHVPYFESTSPTNVSYLKEQHDEVLPPLPNWGQRRNKSSL